MDQWNDRSHSVVIKIDQLLYDRSVVRIFIQLWLTDRSVVIWSISSAYFHSVVTKRAVVIWSISCAYFHSVVTIKTDQLFYDRSVVRIFIQLSIKLTRRTKRKESWLNNRNQFISSSPKSRKQMLRLILLTATMKMKCCYSNQFVKDWCEILKAHQTKAIPFSSRQEPVRSRSRILG